MELTPIRIPGKIKIDFSKSAIAARKALKRPKGRPLKLQSSKDIVQSVGTVISAAKRDKNRTMKNLKSKRKMSLLEKLPTEILENVFLYCLNLELPRSSPIIGGKLSSPSVYSRTVIAAFDPTWDEWYGKPRPREGAVGNGKDASLQSTVLRCRWASLEVLIQAKDTWIQRYGQGREFNPKYFVTNNLIGRYDFNTVEIPQTAEEYLNLDFDGFSHFAKEIDGRPVQHITDWYLSPDMADGVEIPRNLLLGPWTDDMIKHLFYLVKSGAKIDWISSTSGEDAVVGLRTAILEGDIRAIHLLQWAGLSKRLDMDIIVWAIENAQENKLAVINHLLRIGFTVISDPEARKLGKALLRLRDEAVQEKNVDKLAFFHAIRKSRIVLENRNVHL